MFFLSLDVLSNVHPLIKIIRPLFLLGRQRKRKKTETRRDKERKRKRKREREIKRKKNRKYGDKELYVCICMYVCKSDRIRTYACVCKYVRTEDKKMVFTQQGI